MSLLPSDFYNGTVARSSTNSAVVPELVDYVIDLETGYLVVSDSGQFILCTGLRAVIMQIWRKLHIMKGEFLIYSSSYGNTFSELVGQGKSYADSYIYNKLTDAIVDKIYVKSISNLTTSLTNDKYIVSFTANTIYGDTSQVLDIDLEQ
jgi:hypothetical protein